MLPFYHHVAVVGPVSAGKSTLLNALFSQMHSPMRVQRTTMVPQVYEETTDPAAVDAPDAVAKRNADANARYLADPTLLTGAVALPTMRHRVAVIGDPLAFDAPLAVYDLPGLDDGVTEDAYFRYLADVGPTVHVFLLVVDLVGDPLNKSGSRKILDKVVEAVRTHDRPARLVVLVNKCDALVPNADGTLAFEDEEHGELFAQVEAVVAERCTDTPNLQYAVTPIAAADALVYRVMHHHPKTVLPLKDINRIGVTEVGRTSWNAKDEPARRAWFAKGLQAADYDDRMRACGFTQFAAVLHSLVGKAEVQAWALVHVEAALARVERQADDEGWDLHTDYLPVLTELQSWYTALTGTSLHTLPVFDRCYQWIEDTVDVAKRLANGPTTEFTRCTGAAWEAFEADLVRGVDAMDDVATTWEACPIASGCLRRLREHVVGTLVERHLAAVREGVWDSGGGTLVTVEHGKMNGPLPQGDATVSVRGVDTGDKIHEFKSVKPVTSVSLSGDGKTLAYVEHSHFAGHPQNNSKVIIRKTDSDAILHQFQHGQEVTSSSLSGDGKTLAVVEDSLAGFGDNKNTVIVRNVNTGTELQKLLHEKPVTSSSLSGDGKTLVAVERCASVPALLANVRALVRLRVAPAVLNAPFAAFDYDTLVCQHHLPAEACVTMWTELAALGVDKRHLLRWAKAYVLHKNVYDTSAWPEHDGRPTYHLALETHLGHLATPNDPDLAAYVCALETRTKWLNYAHAAQVPWTDDVAELPELAYVFALWCECTADAEDAEYVECE